MSRDCQGGVGGAVIHHDDLDARPRLRQGGRESIGNPPFGVVGRNEDRDKRLHRRRPSSRRISALTPATGADASPSPLPA